MPLFTLAWNYPETSFSLGKDGADFPKDGGLTVKARDYYPEPYIYETTGHVICILGNPILGECINKQDVAKRCLSERDGFVSSINGEFLIIHLDKLEKTLTVINDRFTSIPFYYAHYKNIFLGSVFYKDIWKELRGHAGFKLNENAFFEFIWLQRLLGTKTYDNYSRFLPAATILRYDGNKISLKKYWTPSFEKNESKSLDDFSNELILKLKQSINRKTSDNPRCGLFLSGGMDSRTLLNAFNNPPICFTVGFSQTNEYRIAHRLTEIISAEHHFIPLSYDNYSKIFDELVSLSGGMYVFDHALFLGLRDYINPLVDVVFHGHGLDYFFQGMYVPVKYFEIFSHRTYFRRIRKIDDDFISDYLSNISFRLKNIDIFRYVKTSWKEKMRESLRNSVGEIIDNGKSFCNTPFDLWEYMLIHNLSRHYTNTNVSSMMTCAEQRTISFDNDIFSLYLSLPVKHRIAAKILRATLRKLNPLMARVESANTGMKIDSSPFEMTFYHSLRFLKRKITGNQKYRHPQAEDRTWPDRDKLLRSQPILLQAAKDLCSSDALATALPFFDIDALSADIRYWLEQPKGGADLIFTLITIDRFLSH